MYYLSLFVKGIFIGFFMLIPGISGGSIAIMLGVYNDIIINTNNLFKTLKKSFIFLLMLALGGLLGLLVSANFLTIFIENYYHEMIYFFLGIMIVYIINFFNENKKDGIKFHHIMLLIFGVSVTFLINLIPANFFGSNLTLFNMIILGFLLAIALILPGISISYILLIFSSYTSVIMAIKSFDILYLFKTFCFVPLGIFLSISVLSKLLFKHSKSTNFMILGFLISSLFSFLPIPTLLSEINTSVIFLLMGILFFLLFGKIIKK